MSGKMMAQVVKAPYQMEYCEVPVPQINDDEVLVKVKVCGICGSDWSIYTGNYAADKLPMITGHEFWGVAAKVGKNVKGVQGRRPRRGRYLPDVRHLLLLQEGRRPAV